MGVACFALIDPFSTLDHQLSRIAGMGFKYADVTDNRDGACLGVEFGKSLSDAEAIFSVRSKLHEPLRMAADCGVKLLLEPHGHLTESLVHMEKILDSCNSDALGINLDTGNLWLGGGDPVAMVKKFGSRIEPVHWKDMPAELEPQRGKVFGAGMATILPAINVPKFVTSSPFRLHCNTKTR